MTFELFVDIFFSIIFIILLIIFIVRFRRNIPTKKDFKNMPKLNLYDELEHSENNKYIK